MASANTTSSRCILIKTKIVILTISTDEDDVIAVLKAGAHGYVSKGISAHELVDVLQAIYLGKSYVTTTKLLQYVGVLDGRL
jgi:DNA-binding NarL/FixJ family response regulator